MIRGQRLWISPPRHIRAIWNVFCELLATPRLTQKDLAAILYPSSNDRAVLGRSGHSLSTGSEQLARHVGRKNSVGGGGWNWHCVSIRHYRDEKGELPVCQTCKWTVSSANSSRQPLSANIERRLVIETRCPLIALGIQRRHSSSRRFLLLPLSMTRPRHSSSSIELHSTIS